VVGLVLVLVKSASLYRLHGLFLVAGVRNGLLVWLSCILVFVPLVFVLLVFLFPIFVYLFGRAWSILWTRDRDALGFESFLDGWELF
jgi:Flp pilus assembly protein TadB